MKWRITGDGEEVPSGADVTAWAWEVEREDGSERRTVTVEISGTAMTASNVHFRVDKARQSRGLSEIRGLLEWNELPRKIVLHSQTTVPAMEGGDPGPDLQELVEIADWFGERGIWLVFSGRSGGTGPSVAFSSQTANLIDPEPDALVERFEAPTRVEAARKAREWWIENHGRGKPAEVELSPAQATSSATLQIHVPKISPEHREQLNRRQIHLVVNGPDASDPDSGYLIEAYTNGELSGLAVGATADDAWLALFDDLFTD
jgi:hypothetical protein